MNKLFLTTLALASLLAFQSYGQGEGLGIKGGIQFSSFGADASGSDARFGINIGGFYNSYVADRISVSPELALSLEGDDNVSFTNINIGVLGKYYFLEDQANFEFGPQLGLIVGDDDTDAESINFSLGFGGNYNITEQFAAGIRYNVGLSSVFDFGGDFFGQDIDVTNNIFSINAYYTLP